MTPRGRIKTPKYAGDGPFMSILVTDCGEVTLERACADLDRFEHEDGLVAAQLADMRLVADETAAGGEAVTFHDDTVQVANGWVRGVTLVTDAGTTVMIIKYAMCR